MQVKNIIEQHATEPLLITGEDYPATADKKLMGTIVGYIQMVLLALVMAGSTICSTLGI